MPAKLVNPLPPVNYITIDGKTYVTSKGAAGHLKISYSTIAHHLYKMKDLKPTIKTDMGNLFEVAALDEWFKKVEPNRNGGRKAKKAAQTA